MSFFPINVPFPFEFLHFASSAFHASISSLTSSLCLFPVADRAQQESTLSNSQDVQWECNYEKVEGVESFFKFFLTFSLKNMKTLAAAVIVIS